MKKRVFVHFVDLYPCAILPTSLAISSYHMSIMSESSRSVLYLVIVSLVIGWTTPLHMCFDMSGDVVLEYL